MPANGTCGRSSSAIGRSMDWRQPVGCMSCWTSTMWLVRTARRSSSMSISTRRCRQSRIGERFTGRISKRRAPSSSFARPEQRSSMDPRTGFTRRSIGGLRTTRCRSSSIHCGRGSDTFRPRSGSVGRRSSAFRWSSPNGAIWRPPSWSRTRALCEVRSSATSASGAAIYDQELKAERKRAEELSRALRGRTRALAGVIAFVVVALAATGYAVIKQRDAQASAQAAEISQRVSQASLYDAQAGSFFEQARRIEARWESLKQRQIEISRALNGLGSGEQPTLRVRRQNLNFESQLLEQSMKGLAATAMASRQKGYAELKLADDAWRSLESSGQSVAPRTRPEPRSYFRSS